MPIYEYQCIACSRCFEKLVSGPDPVAACPDCSSTDTRKLLSAFGMGKGSGASSSPSSGSGCGGCSSSSCAGCK